MRKYALQMSWLSVCFMSLLGMIWLYKLQHFWGSSLIFIVVMGFGLYLIQKLFYQCQALESQLVTSTQTFHKLSYDLPVASSQVSAVSKSLSLTLEENNAFTQELFIQTEEMSLLNTKGSTAIHEALLSIKEVLKGLEQVDGTTTELKDLSRVSHIIIHESLSEILNILVAIQEMEQSAKTTLASMKTLTATSKKILSLLDTVQMISNQTHLLALNASIESARAGEAGKGFAVVAEEIRKLSTNTSLAVSDVNALISSIQQAIEAVNTEVLKNFHQVEVGVTKSKHLEDDLEKMQHSFEKVVDLVEVISGLAQQELTLAQKADTTINAMETSMEQTALSVQNVWHSVASQKKNIEEIAEMGGRLNDAAQLLSLLLKDYHLDDLSALQNKGLEEALVTFKEILANLSQEQAFGALDSTFHQQALQKLKATYSFIEAIWTNGHKGRFIVSIPPAGIANGSVREWFQKSIQGELYVSAPYISAITHAPCLTLSAPIREKSGTIRGVIGLDITLEAKVV